MSRLDELEARVEALESELRGGRGRPGFRASTAYDRAWGPSSGLHEGQGGVMSTDR